MTELICHDLLQRQDYNVETHKNPLLLQEDK
jgi:hypothetical protein